MNVLVSEVAEAELDKMDSVLRSFFIKHMEKIAHMPPRRHMKFGLPFTVENVTKQARLVYQINSTNLIVVRCFATHKEYEKWYLSYK
ncbi:hypothetical protein HZC07_04600 [Candidatus Micrarchaeota archaeon]|nr:hypothetical protein [Candidatus Micrarchaeota archaeon]